VPDPAPIILLTRPMRQSQEFAALLPDTARVIISPVLEIRLIEFSVEIEAYDPLIFASQNAVYAASLCMEMAGKRAVTVGERTAAAARKFGMSATAADGNAQSLIAAVVQANPRGKALFIHGRYSRGNVASKLTLLGIDTDSIVAYDQNPVALSRDATGVLCSKQPVVLPLFSPRSADILSAEARRCGASAPLCLVAMSHDVLAGWAGPQPAKTVVAPEPTADAVLKAILGQIARRG